MEKEKLDPFEEAYIYCMLYGIGFVKITREGVEAVGPNQLHQVVEALKWQKENSINLEDLEKCNHQ